MDWTSQTNELMKGWTEAQKQLMSSWISMLPGAAGAGMPGFRGFPGLGGFPGFPGFGAFPGIQGFQGFQGFPGFDPGQWMKMAADTWSHLTGSTSERVAGNIFGAPDVMARSVSLILKAWQLVAPKIEAGQDWRPDLKGVLETWQKELVEAPQRQMATMNEFTDLTRTLFERWSPLTGPWMTMVSQALAAGHPGAAFMGGTAPFGRMMGMEEGLMPIMSGLGELPRGTVLREKMGKMLRAVDALTDLRKAQGEYHKAMGEAMSKAVERTVEHLAKLAEKGEAITSVRDLMRTWFTTADQTLNEVFVSKEFLDVQDGMTNALMTFKVRQREALDIIYQAMDLPTRAEVDEAYKDIHDLKREVRMLKRQVKEAEAAKPAKAPARAAKPAQAE